VHQAILLLLAIDGIALGGQQQAAIAAARAFLRNLLDTLCRGPFFVRRRRKWHCRLYIDYMGLRHHTSISLGDIDRRLYTPACEYVRLKSPLDGRMSNLIVEFKIDIFLAGTILKPVFLISCSLDSMATSMEAWYNMYVTGNYDLGRCGEESNICQKR